MSNDQYQREMAMALDTQPPIFKLNVDCFEELFDYLSLEDLHAFGQTCKIMQQLTGYYFRLTYPGARVNCTRDGIYCNVVQINGFSDFIENITFCYDCSQFAKSKEFKSLKKICFDYIQFDDKIIACIKKFLCKIEIVELNYCSIGLDFYGKFLRYCTKMKRLCMEHCDTHAEMGIDWLLQQYSTLEKFIFTFADGNNVHEIDELTIFFKRNLTIQHFATDQHFLRENRQTILSSNVKLDTLAILHYYEDDDIDDLLNEFRERDVYKRLHQYVFNDGVDQLVPTFTAEKLAYFELQMHVTSSPFVNLKEFCPGFISDNRIVETLANSLVDLELIYFKEAYPNQVLAFIRHSRKLSHIGIKIIHRMKKNCLDLGSWNKEREKLPRARKVTIYVDEKVFLATKQATQNNNYKLIDIKRLYSHCWQSDFENFFS